MINLRNNYLFISSVKKIAAIIERDFLESYNIIIMCIIVFEIVIKVIIINININILKYLIYCIS